jgi:diadenylate cyclase
LGARHRAALAISEVSDSVTIVVSEQTGSIRIFKNGAMKQIKINDFFDVFPIYME